MLHTEGEKTEGRLFQLPNVIQTGERNSILFRYGAQLRAAGRDREEITVLLNYQNEHRCDAPIEQAELNTIINQVCRYEICCTSARRVTGWLLTCPGSPQSCLTLEAVIPDPKDDFEDATEKIWREQLHKTLEKALSGLSPEHEKALKLRYFDELGYKAISEKMCVSYDAVRQLVAAAKRSLWKSEVRKELEEYIDLHTNFYFGGNVERQESPVEILAERREWMRERYRWKFTDEAEMPAQEA